MLRASRYLPALLVLGLIGASGPACASCRFEGYTAKAAKGRKIKPQAATFLGSKCAEEFVSVGAQPDGTVVALGNLWGPDLPPNLNPKVIGEGEWYEVTEYVDGEATIQGEDGVPKPAPLDARYPNKAGLIVRYSPDLQKILGAVRFDWGVASVESGLVAADGGIIVHGRATEHFGRFARQAGAYHEHPKPDDPRTGRFTYQGRYFPGDVYVARLSPDAGKLEWVWLLKGHRETGTLRFGPNGSVVFQCFGFKHISADGRNLGETQLQGSGQRVRFLDVSPKDGTIVRGGDTCTGTGREPWRKPLFYGYDLQGKWLWSIYDWPPGLVGHDDFRLVSDSAVRVGTFDHDGNFIFYGWSDGGNTVFTRNPIDLEKGVPKQGFGMSLWGAGVGSFCHLVRLRSTDFDVLAWTVWVSYLMPDDKTGKDQPNGLRVNAIWPVSDGSVALTGDAGTWMIQTPDPWFRHPKFDKKEYASGGRGPFVAVFNRDFSHLFFSRTAPGCEMRAMCETPGGLVFAGRSVGTDRDDRPTPTPVLNALQKDFGGRFDAYLLLLEKPLGGDGNE